MKINNKKSGIIFHKKRKSSKNQPKKYIEDIPICRKYRYLGIIINETLSSDDYNELIEEKTKKAKKMIKIMKWKRCDLWLRIYAWMVYITPHYRYGAQI